MIDVHCAVQYGIGGKLTRGMLHHNTNVVSHTSMEELVTNT